MKLTGRRKRVGCHQCHTFGQSCCLCHGSDLTDHCWSAGVSCELERNRIEERACCQSLREIGDLRILWPGTPGQTNVASADRPEPPGPGETFSKQALCLHPQGPGGTQMRQIRKCSPTPESARPQRRDRSLCFDGRGVLLETVALLCHYL
jgi:hypothetical protein